MLILNFLRLPGNPLQRAPPFPVFCHGGQNYSRLCLNSPFFFPLNFTPAPPRDYNFFFYNFFFLDFKGVLPPSFLRGGWLPVLALHVFYTSFPPFCVSPPPRNTDSTKPTCPCFISVVIPILPLFPVFFFCERSAGLPLCSVVFLAFPGVVSFFLTNKSLFHCMSLLLKCRLQQLLSCRCGHREGPPPSFQTPIGIFFSQSFLHLDRSVFIAPPVSPPPTS